MRKIPTLFVRDPETHIVTSRTEDAAAWVLRGEGYPTEKLDGTNVRVTIRRGEIVRVEKRREPSQGQKDLGIIDPWYIDASPDNSSDQWICAAAMQTCTSLWPDGVHNCEAIGPKIQGNPYGLDQHRLWPFYLHPPLLKSPPPLSYNGLRTQLPHMKSVLFPGKLIEGIIWHHPDGRRAKIKRKDFGC